MPAPGSVVVASVAVDTALLILKIAFLVLLYLFIWRIVRTASRDLRLPQESFILAPSREGGVAPQPSSVHTGRLVVVKSAELATGWTKIGFDLPDIPLHTNELSIESEPASFAAPLGWPAPTGPVGVAVGDVELSFLGR